LHIFLQILLRGPVRFHTTTALVRVSFTFLSSVGLCTVLLRAGCCCSGLLAALPLGPWCRLSPGIDHFFTTPVMLVVTAEAHNSLHRRLVLHWQLLLDRWAHLLLGRGRLELILLVDLDWLRFLFGRWGLDFLLLLLGDGHYLGQFVLLHVVFAGLVV